MKRFITIVVLLLISATAIAQQRKVLTFKVDNVKFKMIAVEGGTYKMGAQGVYYKDDNYDPDVNGDYVQEVTVGNFYIAEYEVTEELWSAVMKRDPHYMRNGKPYNLTHPVELSHEDCLDFIEELNRITGEKFRMPTNEEWEYAARGGNRSHGYMYSGSDNIKTVAWYRKNAKYSCHAVGKKKRNELGIFDMSGNAAEWISGYGLRGGDYKSNSSGCKVNRKAQKFDHSNISHEEHGIRLVLSK